MTPHTLTARRAADAPGARSPDDACGYLPIAGYGIIGNLRTVALVGVNGSVDWCCFPDIDGPSVFAAILDTRRGGRFRVRAAGAERGTQRYLPETNVLETTFAAAGGRLRVTDFMPLAGSLIHPAEHYPAAAIFRVVECVEGAVEVEVEWSPRFDYARARPRIIACDGAWQAVAGPERMTLRGLPAAGAVERDADGAPVVRARFPLAAGERVVLDTHFGGETERDAPGSLREEGERALRETVAAWEGWSRTRERPDGDVFAGEWREQFRRAALVLKLLTHRHTGAIVAAATTSLPEDIGGVRNWDYRYTWLRDASFTAQALFALGHRSEAVDFIRWLVHVSRAKGEAGLAMRIMYRVHGETDVTEIELPNLEGYRGSRPVRIGNAAVGQRQLDIYGELLGATYEVLRHGERIEPSVWDFLSSIADRACDEWCLPDHGIWEVRGPPRHYVHSKVMAWVALDRAVRMAEQFGLAGNVARWRLARAKVKAAVLHRGYDKAVGAFVQSFGSTALDAANLLIPIVEFLPFDDPRVQGTIAATMRRLTVDGVVYRYLDDDGLPGGEGAFGLTTFWLVEALALSGRTAEARELFAAMAARANHLGLYSEEFDPRTGEMLGNFPQAFTHIGFVNAALYLAREEGAPTPEPAPVGSREHREEGRRKDR